MGSGKTRHAKALADHAGIRIMHADVVRKRLAGLDPRQEHKVPFGEGIYSPEWTDRTYGALLEEAADQLALGNSIILDATWSKAWYRALARDTAAQREALFTIVECTAPDEVLKRRLSRPDRSITDGRLELLDDQRAAYEAPTDGEAERLIRIDTSDDFESAAAALFDTLFAEPAHPGSP